jgi:hypothetical protein
MIPFSWTCFRFLHFLDPFDQASAAAVFHDHKADRTKAFLTEIFSNFFFQFFFQRFYFILSSLCVKIHKELPALKRSPDPG